MMKEAYHIGLDIGSTTAKIVVLDPGKQTIVYSQYQRHKAQVPECLARFFSELCERLGDADATLCLTGSVGMGISEQYGFPFIQEVVAASHYLKKLHPEISTMIDIGGEDAKVVFLHEGTPTDLRMNGNCAGGTGAFIDQMAVLLNVTPAELGTLAERSTRIYPIASRCGVFCKTDIQNLIARNVPREDIAASIFHAVSVQTVITLAHGHTLQAPILFCGGPLTFIPALRTAFSHYLRIPPESFILPEHANLIPAWGAALSETSGVQPLPALRARLTESPAPSPLAAVPLCRPIFGTEKEYEEWKERMSSHDIPQAPLSPGSVPVVIGIDSGSTTTKIAILDRQGHMLCSHYRDNNGNPIQAVEEGLEEILRQCRQTGTELEVTGSCSTGYGEELVKAAFQMDAGIIETMAHYMAAKRLNENVSFILDIGGQDMKAIFTDHGAIHRIEVNEACSSGCGSFISAFARSLNTTVGEFAQAACLAPAPCDLGTRCTVFMNSRVKQVLREGASLENIAAGLSYSVIRNCLYKVLRLKDTAALGDTIVVQGGTMRNDSIVRCLEHLTGKRVLRSDRPELMGALGCALYALELPSAHPPVPLQELQTRATYTTGQLLCRGCENQCAITRYRFESGRSYFSGNRCEKVFNNSGGKGEQGANAYEQKRKLLFDRDSAPTEPLMAIGIPRCLNMYEEYPFWHTLLSACNIRVCLSKGSSFARYEQTAGKVMSDNICFPAKLAHSHIEELISQKVDRIFMPFVLHEKRDKNMQNSYNCPIVSGYSQVIQSVQSGKIPIDTPLISFLHPSKLRLQCEEYMRTLGIDAKTFRRAFKEAQKEQARYEQEIAAYNETLFNDATQQGKLILLLAGRPYHTDPLIQHKVSEMAAALGACVLTDDIVRGRDIPLPSSVHYLSQWAFPNRILQAAQWAAQQGEHVQFIQLTSFGCGPDAFLTDEIHALLKKHGKNHTLLKIDDINNIGSLKLRVRSLIESLRIGIRKTPDKKSPAPIAPIGGKTTAGKKIIVPFFTPYISPLAPALLGTEGYDVDTLPLSDAASCDWGLKYANNEVCYPATLIVGDIIKAFRNGAYHPEETCVAITQTGGQCRASNYITLIQKALQDNGYGNVPILSLTFGNDLGKDQPHLRLNWLRILPKALVAILYSDCIARFYHASVIREKQQGKAAQLRDSYLESARQAIANNRIQDLYRLLEQAAKEFGGICREEPHPQVGLVGEIFLKFHPFAQRHVTDWLIGQGIEVVYPALIDFFLQSFVNRIENQNKHLTSPYIPAFIIRWLYGKVQKHLDRANAIGKQFRYFTPFDNIYEKAELARPIISLHSQFGEGWLIAAEMASLSTQGVQHIISLQPFGCIANHIISKGIENKIRALYPQLRILSLDFDSSVSEVNITNRLLLFIHGLHPSPEPKTPSIHPAMTQKEKRMPSETQTEATR